MIMLCHVVGLFLLVDGGISKVEILSKKAYEFGCVIEEKQS